MACDVATGAKARVRVSMDAPAPATVASTASPVNMPPMPAAEVGAEVGFSTREERRGSVALGC
jgi:hypothetical protein